MFIVDNLEISLANTVDKARGKENGYIMESLLKIEHQSYLSIHNTLWMGQCHQFQYQAHMRIFQQLFWDMDRWIFFRWMIQCNQVAQVMEGYRTKAEYSGTSVRPAAQVIC